jgi:eukaryotic-like serine/threonine-protein kinase
MSSVPPTLSDSLADRYRIDRVLGAGGMATVYLAHDVRHDRQVAVKVVKPDIVSTIGADRFVKEIRTTSTSSTLTSFRSSIPVRWATRFIT